MHIVDDYVRLKNSWDECQKRSSMIIVSLNKNGCHPEGPIPDIPEDQQPKNDKLAHKIANKSICWSLNHK